MRMFALGFLAAMVVMPAALYLYLTLGYAPVAVTAPPLPFEEKIAHLSLHAHVAKHAPKEVPIAQDEAAITAGAKVYAEHCSGCHGLKGKPRPPFGMALSPTAPDLLNGEGVTDDPTGEIYWVIANGIRLTGMAGFRGMVSDKEMWEIAVMLKNADKLPAAAAAIASQPPGGER